MKKKKSRQRKLLLIIIIFLIGGSSFFLYNKFKNLDSNNDNDIIDNISDDDDEEEEIFNPQTCDEASILQYDDGKDAIDRLKTFQKRNKKIKSIVKNAKDYPEVLIEALSYNYELADFVYDYNQKIGKVTSDDLGDITYDDVPELYQWDERWGYGKYGSISNVAISGCGPTSLAMVIAYLKKDNSITPYEVAKMAEEKGYYQDNSGTTWDLIRKGPSYYGLKVKELPLDKGSIYAALNKNHPIIINVRKGDFTLNGHYLVLAKVEDDKLKVNDPNSTVRSHILWDYERIKNQIKNLWEIYL